MNDKLLYLGGFLAIVAILLALYPYHIGLNAATNLRKPFRDIDVKTSMREPDRYMIALIAVMLFGTSLFLFDAGGIAIIFGSLVSSIIILLDYRRIYAGNRDPQDSQKPPL